MKATTLLKKQHDEVRLIFKQLEKGNGHSKALMEKLATNLVAHMTVEQAIFYPLILKVRENQVLESYEEHEVARFGLKSIMKIPVTDRTFKAKLTTLREIIEHHIDEEERDLFPAAEKILGDNSDELCAQMKARFEATKSAGYGRAVGRGGAAIKSAKAPTISAR